LLHKVHRTYSHIGHAPRLASWLGSCMARCSTCTRIYFVGLDAARQCNALNRTGVLKVSHTWLLNSRSSYQCLGRNIFDIEIGCPSVPSQFDPNFIASGITMFCPRIHPHHQTLATSYIVPSKTFTNVQS
jgi:hypothetical protein